MKRMTLAVFLGFVCLLGESQFGIAQESASCSKIIQYFFGDTQLPGSYDCQSYPGTYQWTCAIRTSLCPPAPCPTCGAVAGRPINLASGNTQVAETDISIPGLGGGLLLNRTWNSVWPSILGSPQGLFGSQWRSNFEESIFLGSDNYFKYARTSSGGAGAWSFGMNVGSSGWGVAAPANIWANLTYSPPNWILLFQDGSKKTFDSTSGRLTSIIDRNGNTTQLSYNTSNQLTAVIDAAGRHLYFTYTGAVVTQVTSDFGTSLSYSYDAQNRLIQVTRPDQTTITYTYDNNSMITSVTDGQGKILESHTYDNKARGLTSSRAAGVESTTISY